MAGSRVHRSAPTLRAGRGVFVLAAVAVLAVGCSNKSEQSSSGLPTPSVDSSLKSMLPADVQKSGQITIATNPPYAPMESFDTDTSAVSTTLIGADIDLGRAIGQVLGVKVKFVTAPFADIIPDVADGHEDLGMSALTVTAARTKVVDFVSYLTAGTKVLVKAGNPKDVSGADDLCGLEVGVEHDTVQVTQLASWSKTCTSSQKPAISVKKYDTQPKADDALRDGRVQAVVADSPVVDYAVKKHDDTFAAAGDAVEEAPYGIAVKQGSGDFTKALQSAINNLIEDGTYKAILDEWGISSGAIDKSEINPSSS